MLAGRAAAASQDATESIWDRWSRLKQAIAVPKEPERAAALDELGRFVEELAPLVLSDEVETSQREKKTLYLAAWNYAESDPGLTAERRIELHELSYRAALRAELADGSANARVRLARVLSEEGRNLEARSVLEQAYAEHRDAETVLPYLLWDLAETCRQLGDSSAALEHIDAAEAALSEDDDYLRSFLVGLRAQVYFELGLPDLAAPWVEVERGLAEALGADELRLSSNLHRGNLALMSGDYVGAIALADSFLSDEAFFDRYRRLGATLLVLRGIAESYLERRDPARPRTAESTLREALLEPTLAETERVQAELRLAELLLRRGAREDAAALLRVARARVEKWRLDPARVPPVPEYAWLTMLEGRLALERGATRSELEQLLVSTRSAFEQFLAQWASAPLRIGGIGFLENGNRRAVLSELIRLHLGTTGPERAVEDLLRAQAMGTLVRRAGGEAGTLADVRRQLLVPGHGIVLFLPSLDRSHAFAIDLDSVEHFELPPEHELDSLRNEHVALLGVAPSAFADQDTLRAHARQERRAAAELAEALLPAGLQRRLSGWEAITFVGAELLGEVALECLPTSRGSFLGAELAVDRLPTLPLGLQLAERAAAVGERAFDLFLFAAPAVDPSTQRRWPDVSELHFGEQERQRLTGAYAPARASTWVGPDANRQRVLATDFGETAVVQFLVHGVVDPERERPLGLVLGHPPSAGTASPGPAESARVAQGSAAAGDPSPGGMLASSPELAAADGVLWSEDVEQLDAPPLVILTACRAGTGPVRRGDEGSSRMSAAWLGRGALAVVQSFANLDYAATLAFSEVLHARLARGDSPAEAMRAARAALLTDEELASPFYHGSIHVVGLAQRPLFEQREPAGSATEEAKDGANAIVLALAAVLASLFVLGAAVRTVRGSRVRS